MSSQGTARAAARPVDATAQARARERLERSATPPWLHGEVARRMAERLPLFRQVPSQVLDAWTPAGGSDAVLRTALPRAHVERLGRPGVVAPWWSPRRWSEDRRRVEESTLRAGRYELVWANMLLHHVPDPVAQFARWHGWLAVGGYLMFSTLGPGTLRNLQDLYRRHHWGSPMAPLVDMHDLGDQLVQAGFADPVVDQETLLLTWDKPDAAVAELRSLGSNADPVRASGLRTPRWRRRLFEALAADAARTASGRVQLEFEVIYGHAFKASLGVRDGTQTRIGLDEMRQSLRGSYPRPPV